VVTNHINFLEVPLLYVLFQPRRIVGMVKVETWRTPILGWLADAWEAIPIRRGHVDTRAFRMALDELANGAFVGVAPEGTRSRTGRLRRGNAGVVLLALRSGAPILPVAHFGGEAFWSNLKRFRRTRVTVRVGRQIELPAYTRRPSRGDREECLERIMASLVDLLPAAYHGYYAYLTQRHGGSIR
jgi:1-acyl-sn-glycerol-3-phosphate acyltransferase